ncbi:MAG TPA: hypothetical protein VLE03_05340 [Nitrospiraceae bacterium]|nr:hypothetical protein [Nitrospiraceae bacterium]
MNGRKTAMETFRQHVLLRTLVLASSLAIVLLGAALPARAGSLQVPRECSSYEGDAQTRCLIAFIELQREKLGKLEGQLQAQEEAVSQLQSRADRQAAASAELQRQLSGQPATSFVPAPYPYMYYYPPGIGSGLYLDLGRPSIYGSPYHYGSHWSLRYYRHWGQRR